MVGLMVNSYGSEIIPQQPIVIRSLVKYCSSLVVISLELIFIGETDWFENVISVLL